MRRVLRFGLALAGLSIASSAMAGVARAQMSERDPPRSMESGMPAPEGALWPGDGELGMIIGAHGRSQGGGQLSTLSPNIRAHYDFHPQWGIHAALPFVQISVGGVDGTSLSAVRLANVALGAHYKMREGATQSMVGFTIAAPTARIKGATEAEKQWTRIAFDTAVGVRGGRMLWLWAPERLSPVLRGGFMHRLHRSFGVIADAEVAVPIPAGDAAADVELFASAAAGGAWLYEDWVRVGAELSLAARPTAPDTSVRDPVQTALKVFTRVEPGRYFLEAGFLVNLDDPYGVSFRARRVWGLFVGFGALYGDLH